MADGLRQQDVCEPLLAIADLIGDNWPVSLRQSLVRLCSNNASQDEEPHIRLLKGMHRIFRTRKLRRISTQEALRELNEDETAPWNEFVRGRPLTAVQLARLLKPLKICPKTIRLKNPAPNTTATPKGYERDDFKDAWNKYL